MGDDDVIDQLQRLIAEEAHLLGRELEDSLEIGQSQRLESLCRTLDKAADLLANHRAVGPSHDHR